VRVRGRAENRGGGGAGGGYDCRDALALAAKQAKKAEQKTDGK